MDAWIFWPREMRMVLTWFAMAVMVAIPTLSFPASALGQGKKGAAPLPDPIAELELFKLEIEKKLQERDAAIQERESALRKGYESELARIQRESEQRIVQEREKREMESRQLREALSQAIQNEEAREKAAIPKVETTFSGVSLSGLVQADLQFRQSSEDQLQSTSGQPLNEDRFLVRRARIAVAVEKIYGEGRFELDANTLHGATLRLLGAEASVKWPASIPSAPPLAKGTLGLFRIPFGFETRQPDQQRLFMERSTVSRALFPGEFDLGIKVSGAWQFIRYDLAVQNGQPLGGTSFSAVDPNHQKDVMGRVGIEDTIRDRVEVIAGISVLRGSGFHAGTLATKPSIQFVDTNEDGNLGSNELKGISGKAAGASSSFSRYGFGADLCATARIVSLGESKLGAEFYLANDLDRGVYPADPKGALGRSLREMGMVFSASQRIRQFEVGIRYDYYDPDRDSYKVNRRMSVPINATYTSWAFAAAMRATWGRLVVEYDLNRNHLGIDTVGMPSNLKNNAILLRGEVVY